MTDLLPDPALAGVVRPMILQFFVLAVLWMQLVAPRGPAAAPTDWTRILLPFLMIATGLLFFSTPLHPVWAPLLGPGGHRIPAIPGGVARLAVLALNLGVVAWCVWRTGGWRGSPVLPLLVALPFAALLVGGDGGWFLLAGGTAAVLVASAMTGGGEEGGVHARGAGPWRMAGNGGVVLLLVLAAWLGWEAGSAGGAGGPEGGEGGSGPHGWYGWYGSLEAPTPPQPPRAAESPLV